ncbi:hypothetical protein chiPu_0027838, partial [Chiloscyllium punctatum]|nr:hypothetical protein [Chiloscyllium punctatum]
MTLLRWVFWEPYPDGAAHPAEQRAEEGGVQDTDSLGTLHRREQLSQSTGHLERTQWSASHRDRGKHFQPQ